MDRLVYLDAATLGDANRQDLETGFERVEAHPATRPEQVAKRIALAQVVITNKVVVNREAMAGAKNLQLICIAATGTNNVDLKAAAELGIAVTNVPGYSTESVVAHTFALYFNLAHNMTHYQREVAAGAWQKSPVFCLPGPSFAEFSQQTWGIVGLGAIGSKVAAGACELGAKVVYHSTSGRNLQQPYPHMGLQELLQTSDVVSLHAPLTANTHHLIGSAQLQAMKPSAYLINTSRGALIDSKALALALETGHIAAAGVDVLEEEPPRADHPLLNLKTPERLCLTPHIAWRGHQSRRNLLAGIRANVEAFFAGAELNRV